MTRLICPTSHSLSSVLALKRNPITRRQKVSPTGNCHAYVCSSLCLSVCPHVSASHCLAVRLSGCPQRLSNSGVILDCPCMVGCLPTEYGCCWAYLALEAAVRCNKGWGRKCDFLMYVILSIATK